MTGRDIVQGTALAGMGLLGAVQPEAIPAMLAFSGLSASSQLPGAMGIPGKALNYPFQKIEQAVAKVVPERTGIPLAASLALPLAVGVGAKMAAPAVGTLAENYAPALREVALAGERGSLGKMPGEVPVPEVPLPSEVSPVIKDAEAVSPQEAEAVSLLGGNMDYVPPKPPVKGGEAVPPVEPPAPLRLASTLIDNLNGAWNAVVRPAANRPLVVQSALEDYSINLDTTRFEAGLLTRQLARAYRDVGFDTTDKVNVIEGGASAPENLRGTLADIIENPNDYKLTPAQQTAINTEQQAGRDWIAAQRERGATIKEIDENYVRHAVQFGGDEVQQTDAVRRAVGALQSVQRARKFPTLRELQTWLDANPEYNGQIKSLNWAQLRQSAFEQAGKAGDDAALIRELAPQRWMRPKGAKYAQAQPPAGYRRVNLPGAFQGKTVVIVENGKAITTRVGDWWLPNDAAAALESELGTLPGFLKPIDTAIQAARDVTLNLDASVGVQFMANKTFGDLPGTLTQLRPLAKGLVTQDGYMSVLDENADLVRAFYKGGGKLGGRFGEYVAELEPSGLLERTIPGLKQLNMIQFERIMGLGKLFAFKTQVKMLTAMRDIATKLPLPNPVKGWTDEQIGKGAAQSAMNEFGSVDYTRVGAGSVRRLAERMGTLTPGFLRSFVGLFSKTPSAVWGDPQGIAQAVFLAQYIGYMSAVTDAASYALGGGWQGADHYDPGGKTFMKVVTPWGSFSPAGQIRTYARLLRNLGPALVQQNPDALNFFLQSRESQPFREAVTQITGKDLFGYPAGMERITGRKLTGIEAVDRTIAAAEQQIPIVGQTGIEAIRQQQGPGQAAAGSFLSEAGLNFWPKTIREKLDATAQQQYQTPWANLETYQRDTILTAHPDLKSEADANLKDRILQGDIYAIRQDARQSVFDDFNALIADIPNQTPDRKAQRDLYSTYAAQREANLAGLDRNADFAAVAADLAKKGANTPEQQIMKDYSAIFERNRDPQTGTQTPEQQQTMFDELDTFEATHTPDQMDVLDRNMGIKSPDWVKALRADKKEIANYWKLPDVGWGIYAKKNNISTAQYPSFYDFQAALQQYAADHHITTSAVLTLPVITDFNKSLTAARQAMREAEPNVDATLAYWGYVDTVRNQKNYNFYVNKYHEAPRMVKQ
jgi:hypothetical protein